MGYAEGEAITITRLGLRPGLHLGSLQRCPNPLTGVEGLAAPSTKPYARFSPVESTGPGAKSL